MPFRLRRDDARFGDLLADVAARLGTAAGLLAELLGADGPQLRAALPAVRAADLAAESAANAVLRALSEAFVTPFDRVDVYRVTWAMRVAVTRITAAAEDVVQFELGDLPPAATELVALLGRAAEVAAEAVPRLQHPALLTDSAVELDRLGRQAREAQRQFVVAVSTDGADATLLVRRVGLAQSLRRAVESFEDLAHALQTVAVKEG
ncbi:MAG TPA: hypothetical protein VE781_07100 [Kineosporiaceae bacterium]|nr:hypothetical protein [Kineosporiaceae bacterium]